MAKKINITSKVRRVKITSPKTERIDPHWLRRKLGAQEVKEEDLSPRAKAARCGKPK